MQDVTSFAKFNLISKVALNLSSYLILSFTVVFCTLYMFPERLGLLNFWALVTKKKTLPSREKMAVFFFLQRSNGAAKP